ncbi:MAG: T9SS type A sorting domain-containing protein [Bacteroidales bacterium]|nr:T9SS type A sorting domain-containing protein [Bacteroidales bacterium]MDD2323638.1 T9SS type A sorting domain-containing protein [Bacteroidales bacterium]MDD3010685.1 T9SS type A sorting domain-containing protein [Bacteroidales bacterium]MDD3960761.1 T9SS type A sorting domain-containing protein [Bacteroidales bacterium]MDY0286529.1 T9SS type A sorting domain-containing protein [Bacteroidales bacterium]
MKKNIFTLVILLFATPLFSQVVSWEEFFMARNHHPIMGGAEFLSGSPYDALPPGEKTILLPPVVDNSVLPFMPPVLNQGNLSSCQQFASVGYGFTYELNHARNTHGQDSANRYDPLFTYNLLHDGNAWNGISMFASLNLLRNLGQPSLLDYSPDENHQITEWMNGYDKWYAAMHNRIDKVYRIDVSTAEGQASLKGWLHNHNGTSPYGGVALFNANSPWNTRTLPPESPEAGASVIVSWAGNATHGMTLVGYNDSIRYDFNHDGLYTHHLDINNDGVTDIHDAEFGAYKFVNSYGDQWGNQGYCYVMYKTMAEEYPFGGVWNHEVVLLTVKEDYAPLLTARYKIKSNSRDKILITAGVSVDPEIHRPQLLLDLPCFRYQGGNKNLTGTTLHDGDILEGGFDLTPLLSAIPGTSTAEFFLIINSVDPLHTNNGEILEFEVTDHRNGHNSVASHLPQPIKQNTLTITSTPLSITPDNPECIAPEYICHSSDTSILLEASAGTPPYQFALHTNYSLTYTPLTFPEISGTELTNPNNEPIILPFSFPFFEESYQTITVNPAGFLMFGETYHPWPYCVIPSHAFRQTKMISAFLAPWFDYQSDEEGIFADISNEKVTIFWVSSGTYGSYTLRIKAAISLFPDGSIILYNHSEGVPGEAVVVSGVSAGDNIRFTFADLSASTSASLSPPSVLQGTSLTSEGRLTLPAGKSASIDQITVGVTDKMNLTGLKTIVRSDQFAASASLKGAIRAGAYIPVDLTLYPYSDTSGLLCSLHTESPYISQITQEQEISFPTTETLVKEDLFSFYIDPATPDNTQLPLEIRIDTMILKIAGTVSAPLIQLEELIVSDHDDGTLFPGETSFLCHETSNYGSATAYDNRIEIYCADQRLTIHQPTHSIDSISSGENKTITFPVTVASDVEKGTELHITVNFLSNEILLNQKTYTLYTGKKDLIIINKSLTASSADSINADFQYLGYLSHLTTIINEDIMAYKSVFLCFGDIAENYLFSNEEITLLLNYLSNGGALYMEAGRIWFPMNWTTLHDVFRVSCIQQSWFDIEQVLFLNDTLTYNRTPNRLPYFFEPVWPAYTRIRAKNYNSLACYCNFKNHKTIASSLQYGYITGEKRRTIAEDMAEFFMLKAPDLSARILSDCTTTKRNDTIQLIVNSNHIPEQITWEIEGAGLSEVHPGYVLATWDTTGLFDVRCTLQYSDTLVTLLYPDYIRVTGNTGSNEDTGLTEYFLYPVPAMDWLWIEAPELQNSATVATWSLVNLQGNVQKTGRLRPGNKELIKLNGVVPGIYMVIVQTREKRFTRKIVIL